MKEEKTHYLPEFKMFFTDGEAETLLAANLVTRCDDYHTSPVPAGTKFLHPQDKGTHYYHLTNALEQAAEAAKRRCKTCRYLDLPTNKAGRLYAPASKGFRCLAPEPELPVLPNSITGAYGFHWPPTRRSMSADEGENCPVYQERPKG